MIEQFYVKGIGRTYKVSSKMGVLPEAFSILFFASFVLAWLMLRHFAPVEFLTTSSSFTFTAVISSSFALTVAGCFLSLVAVRGLHSESHITGSDGQHRGASLRTIPLMYFILICGAAIIGSATWDGVLR